MAKGRFSLVALTAAFVLIEERRRRKPTGGFTHTKEYAVPAGEDLPTLLRRVASTVYRVPFENVQITAEEGGGFSLILDIPDAPVSEPSSPDEADEADDGDEADDADEADEDSYPVLPGAPSNPDHVPPSLPPKKGRKKAK